MELARENSNFSYEGVTVSAGCAERVAVQDAVRDARIHSAGGPHRQQVLDAAPYFTLILCWQHSISRSLDMYRCGDGRRNSTVSRNVG